MKNVFYALFISMFLASCESDDFATTGFKPLTGSMLLDSITPTFQHDYLEIRDVPCWDSTFYIKSFSKGIYPLHDTLYIGHGINYSSVDVCMFCAVLTVDNNLPTFWTTYEDVVYLLSPIDCVGDVLFLARLKGYSFKLNDSNFGIKEHAGKFYLKALKVIKYCTPVQTDQFLLEIDEAGVFKIIDQKVYRVMKDACI